MVALERTNLYSKVHHRSPIEGLGGFTMPISFDRSVCCNLNETTSREWLITNGLGGYAAGTIAGVLTRMEHGLLVASLPGTTTAELLLAKLDEEVIFDERTYLLGTNEYRDGTVNPSGFVHLETFRLEEGFPIFTYRLGGIDGIMLEKRIWMPPGRNTTYIQYRVLRTTTYDKGYRRSGITGVLSNGYSRQSEYSDVTQRTLTLTLLPLTAYRPHNKPQYGNQDWYFQVQHHRSDEHSETEKQHSLVLLPKGVAGCTVRAWDKAHPYHILAVGHPNSQVTFLPTGVWYWNFLRRHDATAGRPPTDDLYLPGVIRATLWPDEEATLTIVVSAEELSSLLLRPNQINLSYTRAVEHQQSLLRNTQQTQRFFGEWGEVAHANRFSTLPLTVTPDPYAGGEELLLLLLQAGNRFVAQYRLPHNEYTGDHDLLFGHPESFPMLLSTYYAMENSTRETLIALPGLLLTTQRYDEALRILQGLARYFKQGLLPDHFPQPYSTLKEQDYGSVDTTLWFFCALDAYLRATRNYELLEEFYYKLAECIDWYLRGTSNGIRVDPRDGLLHAEQTGKALTWMNAVVDGKPVTPRSGKAVEVNALWYNALALMNEWSQHLFSTGRLTHTPALYREQLALCKRNFQQRFWYSTPQGSYLYDVIDGPTGDDTSLRPNQLFALSLRYAVLAEEYHTSVFDTVTAALYTPYGLRTLAATDPKYCGQPGEQQQAQLQALHQGSVWSWLIGPYTDALLKSRRNIYDMARSRMKDIQDEYFWRRGIQHLEPFLKQFNEDLLMMDGGVYDGEAPHQSHYRTASALSMGELLRTYEALSNMQVIQQKVRIGHS